MYLLLYFVVFNDIFSEMWKHYNQTLNMLFKLNDRNTIREKKREKNLITIVMNLWLHRCKWIAVYFSFAHIFFNLKLGCMCLNAARYTVFTFHTIQLGDCPLIIDRLYTAHYSRSWFEYYVMWWIQIGSCISFKHRFLWFILWFCILYFFSFSNRSLPRQKYSFFSLFQYDLEFLLLLHFTSCNLYFTFQNAMFETT